MRGGAIRRNRADSRPAPHPASPRFAGRGALTPKCSTLQALLSPTDCPSPLRIHEAAAPWAIVRSVIADAPFNLAVSRRYPRNALFSGSNGLSAMTIARRGSPSTRISSSVPAAAQSGLTIASASDLPVRQP